MSVVTWMMPALDGELFGEGADTELIGTSTVLEAGPHRAVVLITAAEIIDDGEAMLVTCRVPEEIAAFIL